MVIFVLTIWSLGIATIVGAYYGAFYSFCTQNIFVAQKMIASLNKS